MVARTVRNESGQATTEYVLIVLFIAVAAIGINQFFKRTNIAGKLVGNKSAMTQFQSAYKYGHPKGKGPDEGAPEYHPRFDAGGTNFRLFIRQAQ